MKRAHALFLVAAVAATGACNQSRPVYVEPRTPCAQHDPLKNLYFGDLHVHTTYSFDAHVFDVENRPEDAYRFAQGQPLTLPPLDANGAGTRTIAIDRPLDFTAVTDHSEFLGEVETCSTPGSATYDSPDCVMYRMGGNISIVSLAIALTAESPMRAADVCGDDGSVCATAANQVWSRIQQAANDAYDKSAACAFTSFIGYEYSAATDLSTLHRNVIFRSDHVPFPTTYFEQPTPQGLWTELQHTCLDSPSGCDVLAIPHNSNESNGNMFFVEYPGANGPDDERAQATRRAQLEPLVEVYQHKAASECYNGLAGVIGAPDEQCGFEQPRRSPVVDCGDGRGEGGVNRQGCFSRLDFVRGVLLAGLQESQRIGVNPYRLGIIASTDTHNGTPGAVSEKDFQGHRGTDDDTPAKRLSGGNLTPGGVEFGPGGLAAVWAEENSRPAIFDALRRREVYGTSGPRIAVRVFGGWNLPSTMCSDANLVADGYQLGVPMGGILPSSRPAGAAPSFVVSALRDPGTSARPSAQLQRVQIVKGWLAADGAHQQVFDIAGGDNGATVDDATCTPSGPGADSLCGVFTDPAFDPTQPAFYYARVLENPTCRWSAFQCNALAPADQPAACSDPTLPRTIQERAWTSPIWYDAP